MSLDKFIYKPYLDGLRAVSIVLVLLHHAVSIDLHPYINHLNGWCGVHIFFVISGYLISSLLFSEVDEIGRVSLWRFYLRRGLRILPVYLVYLGSLFFLFSHARRPFYASLLFMTEWDLILQGAELYPKVYLPLWSLSVEEKFYLLAPLLLTFVPRQRLLGFLVVLVGALNIWKFFLLMQGASQERMHLAFDTQIDAILIGIIAALLQRKPWYHDQMRKFATPLPILLLLLYFCMCSLGGETSPVFFLKVLHCMVHLPMFCVTIAFLILSMEAAPGSFVTRILSSRPLVAVGKLSYSIYIWHMLAIVGVQQSPLGYLCSERLAIVNLIVIFAVSACSYYCVERPFVILRKRFTGRRKLHDLQGRTEDEAPGVIPAV